MRSNATPTTNVRMYIEAEEHAIEEEVDENERQTPSIQAQPNKKS